MKNYKRITMVGAVILTLLMSACSPAGRTKQADFSPAAADSQGTYQKITVQEAKRQMDNGGVTVVDVRRPDEYENSHIPGALNVPNEEIAGEQPEALPDRDAVLLVYCRTGVRSKQAADKLLRLGYTQVRDMGGIVDWPYNTVSGAEPGIYSQD